MAEKYRLSLDMGTNSIGWACYLLNEYDDPSSLMDCGSRIFNDGRDEKSKSSLKADRRLTRLASRRRDRFLRRQKTLLNVLVKLGFMPKDKAERKALERKDPWLIRKIALDKAISPHDMGRALFHINQRRGFKSNRIAQDSEAGVVHQSIKDFQHRMSLTSARTVGEFMAKRSEQKKAVRGRRHGKTQTDLYDFYPERSMLEDEVDRLWDSQKRFNEELYTDEARDEIKAVIFHQRKLKPQIPGKCQFLSDEYRAAKALPSFQRFRIYSELANLRWIDRRGNDTKITAHHDLRNEFAKELEVKRKLSFDAMRRIMKKMKIVDYDVGFNLESERRKELDGNLTSCVMRAKPPKNNPDGGGIGTDIWDSFDETQQDELVELLLDDQKSDEDAAHELRKSFNIPEEKIEACLNIKLAKGHGSLSLAAINRILPVLIDQGLDYSEAVKEAGLGEANMYDPNAPLQGRLDYYGKALEGHVVGGSGEGADEQKYGTIPNPTVHIALNQLRGLVNELIRRFGKPYQIVLEIGRDLPLGAKSKAELERQITDGQNKNQKIRDELSNLGITAAPSRSDLQKYKLWEQLAKDPSERRCVFSGQPIGLSQLFSAEVEIEHLLPHALTLDDSMANKTVCFRQANRDKGRRSPYEAFGDAPEWTGIMARVKNLPKSKQWRFQPDAMEKFADTGGFLARHVNDMRYISRYTRQYLTTIVPENQIWVVTGQLTAMLRKNLGLESVLHDHNQQTEDEPKKKNRNDHRHHAVDAIVIGLISRPLLQRVSRAARYSEHLDLSDLFSERQIAWDGFRGDVKQKIDKITVSHRPRRKNQGSLHNETAYGLIEYKEDGPSTVVHRISVDSIKKVSDIDKIKDEHIRQQLLEETYGLSDKEFTNAVMRWCSQRPQPIRRVKIVKSLSVVPIKNSQAQIYKGYEKGGNAFMDIFISPETGKWTGEIVSRFDANQPNSNQPNFIPKWQRRYPELKRKMRLRINDVLSLTEDGVETFYRVQKMTSRKNNRLEITMAPLSEANVDNRNKDKQDAFKYTNKSPLQLQKAQACKVHISPTGLIRRERK